MKKFILPLVLFAGIASAAVAVVSWDNPTTNTNGTAIPATGAGSLTTARVEWGTCNADNFGTVIGSAVVPSAQARTYTTPDLPPGRYCFRSYVSNTYNAESGPSNVSIKVVAAPIPNPPTNFTVN